MVRLEGKTLDFSILVDAEPTPVALAIALVVTRNVRGLARDALDVSESSSRVEKTAAESTKLKPLEYSLLSPLKVIEEGRRRIQSREWEVR